MSYLPNFIFAFDAPDPKSAFLRAADTLLHDPAIQGAVWLNPPALRAMTDHPSYWGTRNIPQSEHSKTFENFALNDLFESANFEMRIGMTRPNDIKPHYDCDITASRDVNAKSKAFLGGRGLRYIQKINGHTTRVFRSLDDNTEWSLPDNCGLIFPNRTAWSPSKHLAHAAPELRSDIRRDVFIITYSNE